MKHSKLCISFLLALLALSGCVKRGPDPRLQATVDFACAMVESIERVNATTEPPPFEPDIVQSWRQTCEATRRSLQGGGP